MKSCTYIIFIHNHENNIIRLVNSLKKLSGDIRKDFIFIDDGSTDGSLVTLKKATREMQKVTILSQENNGYAVSLNKAAGLVMGDYVHFVEGDEVLHSSSTDLLIKTSLKLNVEVVVGQVSCGSTNFLDIPIEENQILIEEPLKKILKKRLPAISQVGASGSLISSNLLKKSGMADEKIYTQNMSLSLRCAKHSSFGYINSNISLIPSKKIDRRFVAYNNIRSIHNFVQENPDIFKDSMADLISALGANVLNTLDKIKYNIKYLIGKFFKGPTLYEVLDLYKKELDKLF